MYHTAHGMACRLSCSVMVPAWVSAEILHTRNANISPKNIIFQFLSLFKSLEITRVQCIFPGKMIFNLF